MKGANWVVRLARLVLTHRRNVTLALGASIIGMVISAVAPVVEKTIIDSVVISKSQPLAPWLAVLVVLGLAGFALSFVRRYAGGRLAFDVQHQIRNSIFEHLQRLDFARHDELATGQLVSRANSDVGLVQGLLSFTPLLIGNLAMLLFAVVVMLVVSPELALVEILSIPVLAFASLRLRASVFPASWDAQQQEGEVAVVVEEAVTGVRVVKGFGMEARELEKLSESAQRLYRSRVRLVGLQSKLQALLAFIPMLTQAGVLGLGGYLALHHHLSIGSLLLFSSYVVQIGSPVRQLSTLLSFSQQARAGAERIFDLLDSNPIVQEATNAVPLRASGGKIEFQHVSFGYTKEHRVLNDFSLTVQAGETVALVGLSGSGKSTLALLVPRFYDVSSGRILIDGQEISGVTVDSLRSQAGVVFEESFLFSDTIRANIAYGKPDATLEMVENAAKMAGAHRFISEFEKGYETVVGERGLTLSGGQRQRVALARALITNPSILLLDDATSAVDAVTESEINQALSLFKANKTVILIAHRRSSLALADRIVLIDKGCVVAEGAHEDLMLASPLYRALFDGEAESLNENVPEPPGTAQPSAVPNSGVTVSSPAVQRISMPRGGGGGGKGMMGIALTATPDLLAALDKLPVANDEHGVDLDDQAKFRNRFSLRELARPFRFAFTVGFLLVAIDTGLTVIGPVFTKTGIDSGVLAGSKAVIMLAFGAFLLSAVADLFVMWGENYLTGRTAERLLLALRVRIFSHLQRLGMDFYESEMGGRIMTRMTTDVDALSNLLQTGLINALVSILSFVGVAIALVVMSPKLTLYAFAVIPPLALATIWYQRASSAAYSIARERIAEVNANLQEGLSGVRIAQAFRRQAKNSSDFSKVSSNYRDARINAQKLVAIYFPFILLLSDLASATILGAGSGLVRSHEIKVGVLIAFTLYVDQLFSPLQQLSQTFDQWQQARVSMNQISKLMGREISTPQVGTPSQLDPIKGEIVFDAVRFAYPGSSDDALSGLDLRIHSGETIALVGTTGAGKSTVLKLIERFYDPTSGKITVDGVDLRNLDLGAYRRRLGFVPQEPFLFTGTVAENIAYTNPQATLKEIEESGRAVGAHDFISTLSGGYDFFVAERGRALSGGQRQLIALARAHLADPSILLLDEATANLDLATEAKVNAALGILARGRTTVIVAHRLPTAARADRVVVIEGGLIVEEGSHHQLINEEGIYASMWRSFEDLHGVA
ncbi:MAG: ABC transporter ATP-binding protein [Actinomycetota bacterium]|nr:ABC transporter ATP-binding protein [Actinomycetota bacterium]